jgi:hypothetical protein
MPPPGSRDLTLHLNDGGQLTMAPPTVGAVDEIDYYPAVGTCNGYWSGGGIPYYLAADQRADEAYALVYNTPPLREELRLLGWPRVILHGSATAQVATFVAKLACVAPDGSSTLIVDGSLNATRRTSHAQPEPMTPGTVYELTLPMVPTGYVVPAGHRLRLAISGGDFPNLWPTPERTKIRVHRGGPHASRLVLPTVPTATLPEPVYLPPARMKEMSKSFPEPSGQWQKFDQITGLASMGSHMGGTQILSDGRGSFISRRRFHCSVSATEPARASIVGTHTFIVQREEGDISVVGESSIRSTAQTFHVVVNLTITRNGLPFFQKTWMASEPRQLL